MPDDFRRLGGIMGINRRNLELIYPHNPRSGFPLVDDKVRTKELLAAAGVPVPRTIAGGRFLPGRAPGDPRPAAGAHLRGQAGPRPRRAAAC